MKLRDLSRCDDPLILFGGPCSNLQATQALLRAARRVGIAGEALICTGDIAAYCGQPFETISEIRSAGCAVVAGNCERQLAAYRMDCGCGFDDGSTCDRLSADWFAHADRQIGAEDRAWMAELPDLIAFSHAGRRCAVIHGGLTDISRFLWPVSPDAAFLEEIEEIEKVAGRIDIVFAGHCGVPFRRPVGAVEWINAGAIGLPANDGQPQTRFAMMRDGEVNLRLLDYDHHAAAEAMRAAGLTQGYDRALLTGYWPSEEVLPPDLRRAALASG